MVSFVTVEKLKAGMVLARDLYGIDRFSSQVIMFRAEQELTLSHITKLLNIDVQGAYVYESEGLPDNKMVRNELKEEVLKHVRDIYNLSDRASENLYIGNINNTNESLGKLIDEIYSRENLCVDIASLRMYDDSTYNHSLGVTVLSIAIGKTLGLSKSFLFELALSALLHDLGKMQVPIEIIQKPGPLTADEYAAVKKHSEYGYDTFKDKNIVSERVLEGILSHHEHVDGSGYPEKLSKKKIPLFGRIIACADVYDALTSKRPYREAYTQAEAIEYIMVNAGRQFDRGVVKAFLKCVSPYPVGSRVKLSNGDTAVVARQNTSNPLRPVIFLMSDPTVLINLCTDRQYLNVIISCVDETRAEQ